MELREPDYLMSMFWLHHRLTIIISDIHILTAEKYLGEMREEEANKKIRALYLERRKVIDALNNTTPKLRSN